MEMFRRQSRANPVFLPAAKPAGQRTESVVLLVAVVVVGGETLSFPEVPKKN